MTDEVRTCISCEHMKEVQAEVYNPHARRSPSQGPECNHPKAHSRDMIYGKAFCINERNDNKGCGKQGKLWESRKNEKKG